MKLVIRLCPSAHLRALTKVQKKCSFTRQAICLPTNSLKSQRTVPWDTEVSSLYRTSAWRRGQVPPLCWSVTRPAVSRAVNLRLRFQRAAQL